MMLSDPPSAERIQVSSTAEPGHDLAPRSSTEHDLVPHERPEDWGWHQDFKVLPRVVGWLSVVSLLLMLIGNHDGQVENLWVLGTAALIVGVLIRDMVRRRNAWRD